MVDSVKQVEYVLSVIAVSSDDTADLINLTFVKGWSSWLFIWKIISTSKFKFHLQRRERFKQLSRHCKIDNAYKSNMKTRVFDHMAYVAYAVI